VLGATGWGLAAADFFSGRDGGSSATVRVLREFFGVRSGGSSGSSGLRIGVGGLGYLMSWPDRQEVGSHAWLSNISS